jgi:DNA (cytosine-5)-methyltransferase 1
MCLNAGGMGRLDAESETLIPTTGVGFDVAHSLRAEGFDASEDGTGRGTPLVPVAFDCKASGRNGFGIGEVSPTLRAMGHKDSHTNAGGQVAVQLHAAVRRLTPRECERLQGFPDDYTLIPHRGKPAADGPRYKALGNSMAVPVMRWIGNRIVL